MDETVILAKLDSLRRCIDRIRSKTPDQPCSTGDK